MHNADFGPAYGAAGASIRASDRRGGRAGVSRLCICGIQAGAPRSGRMMQAVRWTVIRRFLA